MELLKIATLDLSDIGTAEIGLILFLIGVIALLVLSMVDLEIPFFDGISHPSFLVILGAFVLFTENWFISILASIVFSVLLHFGFVKRIRTSQSSIAPSEKDMIGSHAQVTVTISSDGVGEIFFHKSISVSNAPAKSLDGQHIPLGSEVKVADVKDGIYFVIQINKLTEEE